jgi:hypothetical protein
MQPPALNAEESNNTNSQFMVRGQPMEVSNHNHS